MGTQKARKGPLASATQYKVGTVMKGSDGNMWKIVATKTGVKRWNRVQGTQKVASSVETLRALKKKYRVTTTGTKEEIAQGLWRVRGRAMKSEDLTLLLPLLPPKTKKEVTVLIEDRASKTVTDYKGMWTPQPKPLRQMSRAELLRHLRDFREAWEKITSRDTDLSDERLAHENDKGLRELLEFYYTEDAKLLAEEWL
jgi:hypothetical protein